MRKNVLVNFRIEEDLKNEFTKLVEANGLTMSDVITASIEEMVKMNRIPLSTLSFAKRNYFILHFYRCRLRNDNE